MGKTTDRMTVNGVTYEIMDTASRMQNENQQGQITDLKSVLSYITDTTKPAFTTIAHAYLYADGSEATASRYGHTSPIAVSKGDLVIAIVNGYSDSIAIVCTCDSLGGNITPKVKSLGNNVLTYSYEAEADGYITISYATADGATIYVFGDESSKQLAGDVASLTKVLEYTIGSRQTPSTLFSGKYIDNNGEVQTNASWTTYGNINLNLGDTITFTAKGVANVVSVLSETDTNNSYFIPLVISTDGVEHSDFTYTAMQSMKVAISTQTSSPASYYIEHSVISEMQASIDALENNTNVCSFASIGVIGDSLASGCSNYLDEGTPKGKDRKNYAWGKFIERNHGVDVTLFTDGGANVFTWLTGAFGLAALQNAEVHDAYIIGLGVNDYSKQASNLGTSADITTSVQSIPASYNSFYGLYSNMIALIKTKAPRSKIFCLTMSSYHANKTTPKAFNTAIRDIVSAYENVGNVYLIDLEYDEYFKSQTFFKFWYLAHSTASGYSSIADHLWKLLNEYIDAHSDEFKDIQWIIHPESDPDD